MFSISEGVNAINIVDCLLNQIREIVECLSTSILDYSRKSIPVYPKMIGSCYMPMLRSQSIAAIYQGSLENVGKETTMENDQSLKFRF